MLKLVVFLLVATLGVYGLHAIAQGRIDVRPAVTPMGTSSSSGVSFAWLYDAAARTVYVCRAGQGVADTLACKAKATLP